MPQPLKAYAQAFAQYTPEERQRIQIARRAAEEGMVLLENNGQALPLASGEHVALFGVAQINFLTGGSGSGAMPSNYNVTLAAALGESDVVLDARLIGRYCEHCEAFNREEALRRQRDTFSLQRTVPELPLAEEELAALARDNATAIVVLSRMAGEGTDRSAEKGDYYLSEPEEVLLTGVRRHFAKLVVVLNTASILDMEWVDIICPDAVLLTFLPGMEGASAAADILTGEVCPSGRLTDTIAHALEDYPSTENFGAFIDGFEDYVGTEGQIPYWGIQGNHAPIPVGETVRRPIGNHYYTLYQEGLYVGYRYFETFGVQVRYPFGYGLSYTSFSMQLDHFSYGPEGALAVVEVTNTGAASGKTVVQLYVQKPDGALEKPARELVAFEKTGDLRPGQMQRLTLRVAKRELSAYDTQRAAYVLEKGRYVFYLGENVRDSMRCAAISLEETEVLQQLCNRGGPQGKPVLREMSKFAPEDTRPKAPPLRQDMPMSIKPPAPVLPVMPPKAGPAKWKLADVYAGEVTMEEFVAQMDVVEMVCLVTGIGMGPGGKLLQPVLDPVTTPVPGAIGVTASILRLGIPSIVFSDGPAGVKVPYKKNQIAFPTGQSLASTWNTVLAEELGACAGGEAADNLVDVWLAPAINLHRNPLCGRNYEYYAEDPLLSGKLAAAVTRGAACSNVGTCLKHFAANNQETNRFYGVDAVISERTLRELYLRGFEIAVQEGAPRAIMTAYNSINGEYCSTKRALLEDIVRGEWGFEGIFMTDWEGGGPYAVESLEAGNDLLMPGTPGQRRYLLDCVLSGRLSRETLGACCGRILRLVLASNSFQAWLEEGQ